MDERGGEMKSKIEAFRKGLEAIRREMYDGNIVIDEKYRPKNETFEEWRNRHFGKGERR